MLKSISFKKLAVLSAGIAIVLSSCGLQNSASESSGTETAAGKTKNFLLVNGYCYESMDQWLGAASTTWSLYSAAGQPRDRMYEFLGTTHPWVSPENNWDSTYDFQNFGANFDGEPCPVGTTFAESDLAESADTSVVNARTCYTQEYVDVTVAGFTQQRDKPDASDAYKAEMQRGIDSIKGSCVKS